MTTDHGKQRSFDYDHLSNRELTLDLDDLIAALAAPGPLSRRAIRAHQAHGATPSRRGPGRLENLLLVRIITVGILD